MCIHICINTFICNNIYGWNKNMKMNVKFYILNILPKMNLFHTFCQHRLLCLCLPVWNAFTAILDEFAPKRKKIFRYVRMQWGLNFVHTWNYSFVFACLIKFVPSQFTSLFLSIVIEYGNWQFTVNNHIAFHVICIEFWANIKI